MTAGLKHIRFRADVCGWTKIGIVVALGDKNVRLADDVDTEAQRVSRTTVRSVPVLVHRFALWILVFGFLLRIAVSFWNGFYGPSFGASEDADNFHLFAVDAANGTLDERDYSTGWIYGSLLGIVYRTFGASLFLAGLLSAVAWLIAAIALAKLCRLLGFNQRATVFVLIIYALLPSSILVTGVPLREVYQMLFVNLVLLAGIHLLRRVRLRYLLLFLASAYAAAWLHAALAAFGVLAAVIFFAAKMSRRGLKIGVLLATGGLFVIAFLGASTVIGLDAAFSLSDSVTIFRGRAPDDARTNYPSTLEFGSDWALAVELPLILFRYLFEPMPWRIMSVLDVYLFVENICRLALIVSATRFIMRVSRFRVELLALTACYFASEGIWAIGTVNWGTASRHHLPMLGCLLLIGFARSGQNGSGQRKPRVAQNVAPKDQVVSTN